MSGPLLGGEAKGGGAPPKQNFSPPKLPSMPTQTLATLAAVSKWLLFFFWKPTETSEKSRPYWRDDLFFFLISAENLVKTRPTQKFWPLQKQILPPLELRSSFGIDMCVKKIVPHQPEASPHVTVLGSHQAKKNNKNLCKSPKNQVSTAMEKFNKRKSSYIKTCSSTPNTGKFARVKGWAKKHRCSIACDHATGQLITRSNYLELYCRF